MICPGSGELGYPVGAKIHGKLVILPDTVLCPECYVVQATSPDGVMLEHQEYPRSSARHQARIQAVQQRLTEHVMVRGRT